MRVFADRFTLDPKGRRGEPSEHAARERMLLHLMRTRATRDGRSVGMSVDVAPVIRWVLDDEKVGSKNVLLLVNSTPIRPPADIVLMGSYGPNTSGGWNVYIIAASSCVRDGKRFVQLSETVAGPSGSEVGGYAELPLTTDDRWESPFSDAGWLRDRNTPLLNKGLLINAVCALAMFHVRNIGTREVKFPRHIRRRDSDNAVRGPEVYRTLTLRPFSEATGRRHGGIPTNEKPLHLVRGHFATYTADRPLFGKYAGTFWREEHEAGNPAIAVVRKTYSIDPAAGPS